MVYYDFKHCMCKSGYHWATLAQSGSCIEPSIAFATGTTSKHQRVTWPGLYRKLIESLCLHWLEVTWLECDHWVYYASVQVIQSNTGRMVCLELWRLFQSGHNKQPDVYAWLVRKVCMVGQKGVHGWSERYASLVRKVCMAGQKGMHHLSEWYAWLVRKVCMAGQKGMHDWSERYAWLVRKVCMAGQKCMHD